MKTYSPKPDHIERRWYVIDASDAVLGRLASEVAAILRGKHKPIFAPHMDTGDHVVVVNADKVTLTGGKEMKKVAYRHSGYPGGIHATRYDTLLSTRPVYAVEKAVRGMLPKNRLGRAMVRKLHVVAGPSHPHAAQKPLELKLGERPVWEGLPPPRATEPAAPAKKERPAKRSTARGRPAAKGKPAAKPKAPAKATTAAKPKAPARATTAAKRTAARPAASEPTKKPATKARRKRAEEE
jgi:large subunit ribosomal protein L13